MEKLQQALSDMLVEAYVACAASNKIFRETEYTVSPGSHAGRKREYLHAQVFSAWGALRDAAFAAGLDEDDLILAREEADRRILGGGRQS